MSILIKMLRYAGLLLLLFSGFYCDAQRFIPGFRFRKKITFDKNKVEVNLANKSYLLNFFVLVQVEHPDLKYLEDAFVNKLTNPQGLDISFSSSTSSTVPLKFQLERYEPATGKLMCWVLLPTLATKGSSEISTSIYLYYGGNELHDPGSAAVESMWQEDYYSVQHFNETADGKIASGKRFNGVSDQKNIAGHPDVQFSFSAWIKLNQVGQEQMIVTNDSIGIGGYQLKINSNNKLVFQIQNSVNTRTFTGTSLLKVNEWRYITISCRSDALVFLLDGNVEYSNAVLNLVIGSPGRVVIGASNLADRYFNGVIDELRIAKIAREKSLFITEYINQKDPAAFCAVGSEEENPNIAPLSFTFVGTRDSRWLITGNWSTGILPGNNKNIRIKAGITADIPANVVLNKLLLETGARIILNGNMQVLQTTELETGAAISTTASVLLTFEGNVKNNGAIDLSAVAAKVLFLGNNANLNYSGTGTAIVSLLEINRPVEGSIVTLLAPLRVKTTLNLLSGTVNANGNLVLLTNNGFTAAVNPVLGNASIIGNVQVQSLISGSFPTPATGRGWRLLSSPVRHSGNPGNYQYQLQAISTSIFVTGKGGAVNGFDPSPNNGATIYTHNQALPGALAQKYMAIPHIQMQIPVGKGFFVYSRGNKLLPNAYQNQIQSPPFANAAPYTITYIGPLFTGDLLVEVFNNNNGAVGDGFNLLGNPYAAPIRWGSLLKVNVGPFIWFYDPLNNNYRVSSNPEEIIQPGTGFFIKVNQGFTSGSVGFNENSKVIQ
ncbi:hypothetical protein AAKU52_002204 [Pedobacter sp. CG_S7]|uniref:LamG domain-containing protein n=1 Tax=Pedobacter sp. CG_S7 TaxID=3143930 RepID=UPI00339B84E1